MEKTMNNIEWKDGAVCYADGKQFYVALSGLLFSYDDTIAISCSNIFNYDNFQLNEIRAGDYIDASEIDTEQRYNDVVAVFGLFGVTGGFNKLNGKYERFKVVAINPIARGVIHRASDQYCFGAITSQFDHFCKRQLTYKQIMSIGELKRMMIERDKKVDNYLNSPHYFRVETQMPKFNVDTPMPKVKESRLDDVKRRNKSKQAYDILKSLDYEYDLAKQKWFKKEWV